MAEGPISGARLISAALFRDCRKALGFTGAAMARALRVHGGRTVRMWEAGDREVPGPVWVALGYMLRERGLPDPTGRLFTRPERRR
jgi:DNA-binding transcriptional regulator YiaG